MVNYIITSAFFTQKMLNKNNILVRLNEYNVTREKPNIKLLIEKLKEGNCPNKLEVILDANECSSIDELVECYGIDADKYIPIKRGGRGAFGTIYKTSFQDGYRALKILRSQEEGDSPKIDYANTLFGNTGIVSNEKIADGFRHEGIIRYYDSGKLADGTNYLVFEWLDGKTLDEFVRLPVDKFAEYMTQVLKAVAHLHEHGYLHNDLRRQNIMVDISAGKERVTILDYTIACPHTEGVSKTSAKITGREICAPEASKQKNLSIWTDIWALGNLMYQCLVGEHPFPYTDKSELEKIVSEEKSYPALRQRITENVPKRYAAIIAKCLAYHPEDRYQSINEILNDFLPKAKKRWVPAISILSVLALVSFGIIYQKSGKHIIVEPLPVASHTQEIKADIDKYSMCVSIADQATRMRCMSFRDAKDLLKEKNYERVALVLEDILAQDQSKPEYYAVLLHAYTEMKRFSEAGDVLTELERIFPDTHTMEATIYGPEIREQLAQIGPGFFIFNEKQCEIPFLAEKYPECMDLVVASALKGDTKVAALKTIVKNYPNSYLAHHELGLLLLEYGGKIRWPGGVIIYENIDTINEGLAYLKRAAEITGHEDSIFREIGNFFEKKYRDPSFAFIYAYRGNRLSSNGGLSTEVSMKFLEAARADWTIENATYIDYTGNRKNIDVGGAQCRMAMNETKLDRNYAYCKTRDPDWLYLYLTALCMADENNPWIIKNCPQWRNLPNWRPPEDNTIDFGVTYIKP